MTLAEDDALEGVLDAVDFGLVVLDPQMRITAWNVWMAVASGIPAAAVLHRRLEEAFACPVNRRLAAAVADALASGASSILTHSLHKSVFALKTRAGRPLVHNVAVRRAGAAPYRCLIQVFDVTIAVERDRMLRERQNARYDAVVDSAPDPILTLDINGTIQLANPAAMRSLGYAGDDLVDRSVSLLFGAQPLWLATWGALLGGQSMARPIELSTTKKSGASLIVEVSAAIWRSEARHFVTIILRDVSDRHRAEERLRELNQTLERRVAERTAERDRMWRLSSDVMLIMRPDGAIVDSNPAWRDVFAAQAEPSWPGNLKDSVAEEDLPVLAAALQDLRRLGVPRRFELSHATHRGSRRWISWNAVAADDMLQAVGRDVTAERDAAGALKKVEEALRQSQKMEAIGQLTGGLAHDFNNLLVGISGSLELLETRLAQNRVEEGTRLIGVAQRSAQRAASLTHRLLAFSRRQTLDPKPTDMNQLVADMDELVRRSVGPTVEITIHAAAGLWPTLVDPNQLENALLNLCINARDAMPDGGRLSIETANIYLDEHAAQTPDIAPGDYAVLRVSDTGTGMPPDVIERAFDPFFTTKPLGEGTGLGLSMVYGFARQSGGQVRIHSKPGIGTSLSIYLPRYEGQAGRPEHAPEPASAEHAIDGETILVVDDEPAIRMLVTEVLDDLNYKVIEAQDGKAGLAMLESSRRIDLLITDVGLPGGINGRQLADAARVLRPGLKIVFITGYAESAVADGAKLALGMHVIVKPFTMETLATRISKILAD